MALAGSWTKFRLTLPRSHKVSQMLRALDVCPGFARYFFGAEINPDSIGRVTGVTVTRYQSVTGALPKRYQNFGNDNGNAEVTRLTEIVSEMVVRDVIAARLCLVWGAARESGRRRGSDCVLGDALLEDVDFMAGVEGFAEAMAAAGWLIVEGDDIVFPNLFDDKSFDGSSCSDSEEERRERNRQKQARYRERKAAERADRQDDQEPEEQSSDSETCGENFSEDFPKEGGGESRNREQVTRNVTRDPYKRREEKRREETNKGAAAQRSGGGDSSSQKNSEVEDEQLPDPSSDRGAVVAAWNALAGPWHTVQTLSAKRRKALNARLKEKFFSANWRRALERMAADPFYSGAGARGWVADFDWFLRPNTVPELIEGSKERLKKSTGGRLTTEQQAGRF